MVLCALLIWAALMWWPSGPPRLDVVVDHDDTHRSVRLSGHPKVETVLAAAGIRPISGRLLSLASHRRLGGHDIAPTLVLDGAPTSPNTVLSGRHHHLQVIDAQDATEAAITQLLSDTLDGEAGVF
jgi:hypothetical protein